MAEKPKRRINRRFTPSGKQAARWLFGNGTEAAEAHDKYQQHLDRKPSDKEIAVFTDLFDKIIAARKDDEPEVRWPEIDRVLDEPERPGDLWPNLPSSDKPEV